MIELLRPDLQWSVSSAPAAAAEWRICEPEEPYRAHATPRLLDQVRAAIRMRHYSYRTEQAYVGWIRRYIRSTANAIRKKWGRKRSRSS